MSNAPPKTALGDPVVVTDQNPQADGVITECSTWGAVNGDGGTGYCYRIQCEAWGLIQRWIGEGNLKLRKQPGLKLDYTHAFETP